MALPFSKFIAKNSRPQRRPLLNESFINSSPTQRAGYMPSSNLQRKQMFWRWFSENAEVSSPVSARVDDTITKVDFFNLDGEPLGKIKYREAQELWNGNFMDQRLKAIWFDSLCTGSGFGLMKKIDQKRLRNVSSVFAKGFSKEIGTRSADTLSKMIFMRAIDEDLRKPRSFDYIASSTMEIKYDDYDVLGYVQHVGTNTEPYSPMEIIHYKLQDLNGKVDGHTPLSTLSKEMVTLWYVKENLISTTKNGGRADKAFVLPEEQAGSVNYEAMVEKLEADGIVQNRHGNMVLTGKVETHDLLTHLTDMEHKEIMLYVASNIAYALRIPVTRIPYLIGKSSSGGDAGGLAESGYWRMIESDQNNIMNVTNTQFLNKHGIMAKFRKVYKMDDLRETQALSMKADAVTKISAILNEYQMEPTPKKVLQLMDWNNNDIQKKKDPMSSIEKTGLMNQNLLNNSQVMLESDKVTKNDTKRKSAINNQKGTNQTGA